MGEASTDGTATGATRGTSSLVVAAALVVVATLMLGLAVTGPALALPTMPAGTTATLPTTPDGTTGTADEPAGPFSWQSPGVPPPGANDPGCVPSEEHPSPVVLVHGTFADMSVSWNLLSPALVSRGHCVFALDYGERGTRDIAASANELAEFVDEVLGATGAQRVSIVGHSQGGMMPRYYLRFLGGTDHVADLVGLSPSNHGTTMRLAPYAYDCPACRQQVAGSDFLTELNRGAETWGKVAYTQIQTRYDEVVLPYTSAFLEDGERTTNILLQDACPENAAEHLGIIYDSVALQWVLHALERSGPADPAYQPVCSGTALPAGANG